MDHYGTMDPHLYPSANPGSLPADCMLSLNNQLSNSSTFPNIHYNSYDQSDFSPPGDSIGGIGTGTMGTSLSMGMASGMAMSGLSGRTPMITSGSATISHHITKNQTPPSLLDFEKQLPGGRDGFSTLQFHRTSAAVAAKQRTDSPGRIRYMLHSVQKLFAKSQSLESHNMKGNVNGRSTGSGGGTSSGTEDGGKHNRRSKSKDRVTKSEATAKRRPRSNMSGYWSSDDLDSSDLSSYHNTMTMMTLGRPSGHETLSGQSKYIHSGYNTISSSKSSNDMKYPALPGPGDIGGGGLSGPVGMLINDAQYVKGGSWSTLTMGQPRQVLQKGSTTLDRSMLKSKSCQQELTCNYLQVARRLRDLEKSHHYGGRSSESTFRDSHSQDISEPPDMPMPTCFRSRSHSYLRAIQAGCSQDDDTASIDSGCSPPPTDSSVCTYGTSTDDLSTQWKTWKEQFASYLIATGLDKAPKEKQLAIFLQRFGTDRPRILPTHTGNNSKPLPLKRSN
ncbi:hypothetical protein XENOCAPTIV_026637 [Xenoophorus captivus]|uniref:Uncharacterized protein n=1 Tax=Xenoophorus captivus TaxID=1517983 RepID=A0ABV0SCP0_9TELE